MGNLKVKKINDAVNLKKLSGYELGKLGNSDPSMKKAVDKEFERRDKDFEMRFNTFTSFLASLSKKTGIVVESTGGVQDVPDLKSITYEDDHTSGDLRARWK